MKKSARDYRCSVYVTEQDGRVIPSCGLWLKEEEAVAQAKLLKRYDTVAGVEVEVELWGRTVTDGPTHLVYTRRYFV